MVPPESAARGPGGDTRIGFRFPSRSGQQDRPLLHRSVFDLLNMDPLAGMEPAVREIAQTRMFAERAMFVTQKMPTLLRWQMELLSLNAVALPAVQQLVTNSTQIATSVERFDDRRHLIVEEANNIGTAYLRVDLLPAPAQPALRSLFRQYLDSRLEMYRKLPDVAAAKAELARSLKLQGGIWSTAVAACLDSGSQSAHMLLLPALNYAERDRLEDRLSPEEESAVIDATRELLTDVAESIRRLQPAPTEPVVEQQLPDPREPLRVLGNAANGVADELALAMLAQSLTDLPIVIEIVNERLLATQLVSLVRKQGVSVICMADLPPSPASKSRYLIKRLHDAMPELRILIGRWSPPAMADESTQALKDAGATVVASTLAETRQYLEGLVEIVRVPAPDGDTPEGVSPQEFVPVNPVK